MSDLGASGAGLGDLAGTGLAWLQRVAPAFRALAGFLRAVAAAGFVATAAIVVLVAWDAWPLTLPAALVLAVLAVVLGVWPFFVLRFAAAVRAVADLPEWLASSPDLIGRYRTQLADIGRDLASRYRGEASFRLFGGGLWRAGRVLVSMSGDLFDHEGLRRLTRVRFVVLAAVGLLVVPCEVALALLVALTAALTPG